MDNNMMLENSNKEVTINNHPMFKALPDSIKTFDAMLV